MRNHFLSKAPPSDLARCVTRGPILLPVLTFAALAATSAAPLYAANFAITTTADSTDGTCNATCSLREAITASNANTGSANVIGFALPAMQADANGVFTIVPATALPTITQSVTINGYSQSGASANTLASGNNAKILVELAGTAATDGTRASFNGLTIGAPDTQVMGLAINRFNNGIVSGATSRVTAVVGCFIGTDASGTVGRGNTIGIAAATSGTLVVGTAAVGNRNVISGNTQTGVGFGSAGANSSTVKNNYIGTNAAGTAALGNGNGVAILGASNIQIGGSIAGEGNLISGNTGTEATQSGYGIVIGGASATGNTIYGNLIGTNFDGSAAIGNSTNGIFVNGGANNLIGGAAAGQGNVVSGAIAGSGVRLIDASGNKVQGNFIGTNAAGTAALGNFNNGIALGASTPDTSLGSPNNVIGGANAGEGNVIAGNGHLEGEDKIGNGILIRDAGSTGNKVQGNLLGVDRTGATKLGNVANGIIVAIDANNTVIGGNTAQARNVISGNDFGIFILSSSDTTVQGNFIGTNAAGTVAIGNLRSGIGLFGADKTVIGGLAAGEENLVSGNAFGIAVNNSTNSLIQGNLVGTDITGTKAIGNTNAGVQIFDEETFTLKSAGTLIGGTADGAGNVVSGNGQVGVRLFSSSGSTVQGNLIGTQIDGVTPLSNGNANVAIQGSSGNTIGGTTANAGNTIAYGAAGVALVAVPSGNNVVFPKSNTILSNSIFGNLFTGIALTVDPTKPIPFSRTPNDPGDGDDGANRLQNFPVLTGAANSGGQTRVSGTLNSTANATFTIQFFANPAPGSNQVAQARTLLGQINVTTDASGNAVFSVPTGAAVAGGQVIPATATNTTTGDTSEISDPIAVDPAGAVQFSAATYSVSENAGTATITVTRAGGSFGPVTVNYSTANGTATAGADYTATSGVLNFAQGETSKTFTIPIADDAINEANETVNLTLTTTNPSTVIGSQATAVLTIVDNDPAPSLSVSSGSLIEGNSGTTNGIFTVTLSAPSGQTVTVNYATADGTATAGSDYTARRGTLTFAPGERTKTVVVPIIGDTLVEADETFTLTLSAPTNATLATGAAGSAVGTGTIVNDDIANVSAVVANDDNYALILGASGQSQASGVVLLSSGVFQIQAPGVLKNDSFALGSTLTVRALSNPKNGRFQLRNDGTLFYLPSTGKVGVDEFSYAISDGKTTATARVRLNVLDRRAPELRFDNPVDRATLRSIGEIRGRVRDRNAGLQTLTLLWRRFDGTYWNGSAWTTTPTELPLTVQGIDWKYTGPSPVPGTDRAKNLLDGRYDLRVSATDQGGNVSRVTNRLTVDNAAPQLQIVQPIASSATSADLNNATPILGLDAISGSARDANGVARIELVLRRVSDGAYWNGRSFTSAPARFPAQLAPNGDWKADEKTPVKIPTLEQLKLGAYLITAYAYDRLGNEAKAEVAIQIVQTNSSGA